MPLFDRVFSPPNIDALKQSSDVSALIKALGYKESYIRWMAASALGELAASFKNVVQFSKAVDALSNIILEPTETKTARWNAVRSLGQIGAQIDDTAMLTRAVNTLSQVLHHKDADLRQSAAESLGKVDSKIKDVELFTWSIQPLIRSLDDKVTRVRDEVINTLGQLDELAIPPLLAALRDRQPQVRLGAAEALGDIGWFPEKDADGAAYWIVKGKWDNCIPIGEAAVDELIASLHYSNPNGRKSASHALVMIGFPAAPSLIDTLQNQEKEVRQIAAETLEQLVWEVENRQVEAYFWIARQDWSRCIEIGDEALQPLLSFIKDKDRDIRRSVIHTLGQLYPNLQEPQTYQEALEPLLAALTDAERDVRQAAATTLGEVGTHLDRKSIVNIIKELLKALLDPDVDMRFTTASALDRVGWQPGRNPTGVFYWIAKQDWESVVAAGSTAIKPLLVMLQDNSKSIREAAAAALDRLEWKPDRKIDGAAYWAVKGEWERCIEIGSPAIKPLCASLTYRNIEGRQSVAHALGQIAMSDRNQALQTCVVESLCRALDDEEIRVAAIHALGDVANAKAVKALVDMLAERDTFEAAGQALVNIGEAAIPDLITTLKDVDDHKADVAASTLVLFGEMAIKPLLEALRDRDSGKSAAWVLEQIGWQPSISEDGAYFYIVRRNWEECIKIGAAAANPLVDAFIDGSESVRQSSAAALGDIGPLIKEENLRQKIIHTLLSGFNDWDYAVRRRCAGALDRLGWKPKNDENSARYWITKRNWAKCVELGTIAVNPLIDTLKDRDEQVRLSAAESLGLIGDKRAVEALAESLKDKGMRKAVTKALRRIGAAQKQE